MLYKRKIPIKLTGKELFKNTASKKFSVAKLWQYAFSNLNSNVLRGELAEFLVEMALSDDGEVGLRNPWGDYDVITKKGTKIEVKCCSYIQDWDQNKLTRIIFSGLKARELYWSEAVKPYSELKNVNKDYKSEIYVFALFKHQATETLDILDLDQWCFFVLSRDDVSRISKNGNSVSLYNLEKNKIKPVSFNDLKKKIEELENGKEVNK